MDISPKIAFEKPSVPTLWIDTSVIIKLTKIARGEALQAIEVERLTRLKKLIDELVSAGKLLCPQADQEEEYVAQRLDKEVHGDFLALSVGIRMRHRQGIFDYQVQLGMKAFVEQSQEIKIPVDMSFHGDPVDELQRSRELPFVIGTNPFRDDDLIARQALAKLEVQKLWEELRNQFRAEKRSYEQQLQEEEHGYADALIQKVQSFQQNLGDGTVDFWEFMGAQGFLFYKTYWKEIGGQPPGIDGLYKFFCSSYFNNLPMPRITSQLGADLLTGNQPILPGDMMDGELMSAAIPVAHWVLTDKKLAERIKRRRIDKDWGTEVFSMSDVEELFKHLEALAEIPAAEQRIREKTLRLDSVRAKVQAYVDQGGDLKSQEAVPLGMELLRAADDLAQELGYKKAVPKENE